MSESPTHPDAPRAGGETPALDLDATLKPCPFCGGAPAEIAPVEINGKWVIECTDCAVNVVLDSRHYAPYRVTTLEQAIAAWNQRALLLARHRDGERLDRTLRNLRAAVVTENPEWDADDTAIIGIRVTRDVYDKAMSSTPPATPPAASPEPTVNSNDR